MSKLNDGGAAFARSTGSGVYGHRGDRGMSLRDWFAGQALAGMLASREEAYDLTDSDQNAWYAAFRAYTVADAMIAQREKGGAS